jgi:hypothetical protein
MLEKISGPLDFSAALDLESGAGGMLTRIHLFGLGFTSVEAAPVACVVPPLPDNSALMEVFSVVPFDAVAVLDAPAAESTTGASRSFPELGMAFGVVKALRYTMSMY